MRRDRADGWADVAGAGFLAAAVALMSSQFAIRFVHTTGSTAGWGDDLQVTPTESLLTVLAVGGIAYQVLIRLRSEAGWLGAVAGCCLAIGAVGIMSWAFAKSNDVLPSDAYIPAGTAFLAVGLLCSAAAFFDMSRDDDGQEEGTKKESLEG